MTDLNAKSEEPMTRQEFEAFLQELAHSVRTEPASWTNSSLDQFLESVSGWLTDMDGYFHNRGEAVPTEPSWQLFGRMLLAGRTYE